MNTLVYLTENGSKHKSMTFELLSLGVLVSLGKHSGIFVPWNRVLAVWTDDFDEFKSHPVFKGSET